MSVPYVERTMRIVAHATTDAGIAEAEFWHWRGNTRYRDSEGHLSEALAFEIESNLPSLLKQFRDANGGRPAEPPSGNAPVTCRTPPEAHSEVLGRSRG